MKNSLFAFLVLLVACSPDQADESGDSNKKFISVAGINPDINPGDNFFMHVNGVWYDSAKIADDQAGVGSYSFLNIPQKQLLENILEEVSTQSHPEGSIEQKVGDFY
jgi:putative endopeptidase